MQVHYIGRWVWFAQSVLVLGFLILLTVYHFGQTDLQHILLLFSTISPMIAFIGFPELMKSYTHDRCERRSLFEQGIFAKKLGDEGCMFKIGCRGPVTPTDCPVRKWNQHVNWPIGGSTPCIGCAQFGFPDKMEPFISYDVTE